MSVERSSRLRRYLRKDYTQLVEFPVEIIGRDGQIRRYSYDDSVRLYQRRIRSAPMRYDDGDLIDAESRHCRQRIEQLRRSYLEHFGWGSLRSGEVGGLLAGPLGAEVVSFLRRVFAAGRDGPTSLSLSLVRSEDHDVLYVTCSVRKRSWFLYAYRLDEGGPPTARDSYRQMLRQLASVPAGPAVERLFVVHEGADVALLLSGEGEWDGPVVGMPPEDGGGLLSESAGAIEEGDAWAAGLRALHDGAVAEAVRTFEHGMEAQPLRACFAQAVAVVALLDNQRERGEFAARFGTLQHPGDPLLAYLLGVAVARAGRFAEARALLPAPRTEPYLLHVVLQTLIAVRTGDLVGAWRRLRAVPVADPRDERFASRVLERVRAEVNLTVGLVSVAVAATLLLPVLSALQVETAHDALWTLLAACGVVVTFLAALVTVIRLRARAGACLAGRVEPELRLVSIDLLPREGEGVH
jgi:hypothetical protein